MPQSSRRLVRRSGVPITHKTPFVCVSFNRLSSSPPVYSLLAQQHFCILFSITSLSRCCCCYRKAGPLAWHIPYCRYETALQSIPQGSLISSVTHLQYYSPVLRNLPSSSPLPWH
ncbi:hypothetical protein CDAR_62641 [Caerostris darwini]|uniref:Uncharacterized protein n=1 Tax=Caerostris darwini TaxID=1538125 RepID=A0AAV4UF84_9ARAC|nr:hypothetical protein CDAR_62641 [Caerostris darwini]